MSTVTDLESYQQFALAQQAQNNAWSAEQAAKQMDFQERMSNTAHQREVADLKAAGLNPVLSANSGASVPNGSMAETDKSAAANIGNILQQVLQAQSAREVAGMYNAATIAAAQIAAQASMYGADQSAAASRYSTDTKAETDRRYPSTFPGIISSGVNELQSWLQEKLGTNNGLGGIINKVVDAISNLKDSYSVNGGFHSHTGHFATTVGGSYDRIRRDRIQLKTFNLIPASLRSKITYGSSTWNTLVGYIRQGKLSSFNSFIQRLR